MNKFIQFSFQPNSEMAKYVEEHEVIYKNAETNVSIFLSHFKSDFWSLRKCRWRLSIVKMELLVFCIVLFSIVKVPTGLDVFFQIFVCPIPFSCLDDLLSRSDYVASLKVMSLCQGSAGSCNSDKGRMNVYWCITIKLLILIPLGWRNVLSLILEWFCPKL